MTEKRKLEFLLLRYVPDVVKGEFVNFGLAAFDDASLVDLRFMKNWDRLTCLDPDADLDLIAKLQEEIRQEVGQTYDRAALVRRMQDSFSGVIQISAVMPVLTERLAAAEVDEVARIFLETAQKDRPKRETAGRRRILETMQEEFRRAGVLEMLNPVPAEPYTKPGDPFKFDYGYRVGGEIKLFQAVSMRTSVDSAVMLAARYPKIVPAMERVAGAAPLLTAVAEAELDRARLEVGFALEMMEESRIRVATTADVRGIAERARVELGA